MYSFIHKCVFIQNLAIFTCFVENDHFALAYTYKSVKTLHMTIHIQNHIIQYNKHNQKANNEINLDVVMGDISHPLKEFCP